MNDTSIPNDLVGSVVGEDNLVVEEGENKEASMTVKMSLGNKPKISGLTINGATVAKSVIPGATRNRNVNSGERATGHRVTGDIPSRYRDEAPDDDDDDL